MLPLHCGSKATESRVEVKTTNRPTPPYRTREHDMIGDDLEAGRTLQLQQCRVTLTGSIGCFRYKLLTIFIKQNTHGMGIPLKPVCE